MDSKFCVHGLYHGDQKSIQHTIHEVPHTVKKLPEIGKGKILRDLNGEPGEEICLTKDKYKKENQVVVGIPGALSGKIPTSQKK